MATVIPTVQDYMTPRPFSIQSHESVTAAQRRMQEHGVRHLIVWREAELSGVVSDRDLAAFQGLPDAACSRIRVEQALTSPPLTVSVHAALNRVAREMVERRSDSAVAVDQGWVVGILTSTDALTALADAHEGKVRRPARDAPAERAPQAAADVPRIARVDVSGAPGPTSWHELRRMR